MQNSVAEVETMLRKQTQFEEALDSQVDQIDEVEKLAQEMIQENHYDSDNIKAKSRALVVRCGSTDVTSLHRTCSPFVHWFSTNITGAKTEI